MKSDSHDPLVRQLSICGQIAEHKAQMCREHGGNETDVMNLLTPEQKEQLSFLLDRLQKQWLSEHAAYHKQKTTSEQTQT